MSDSLPREKYHKVFLVFGPTQNGKSSFINQLFRFSGSSEQAEVGNGRGKSVTLKAQTYNICIMPELFPDHINGYDTFQIIDLPGLFDSDLRIEKEEIFAEIKKTLLQHNIQTIDCILVFESIRGDTRKLNITMSSLIDVFGEMVRSSVLVLSTKWDKLNPDDDDIDSISGYLDRIVLRLGIQHLKWQNNVKIDGNFLLTRDEEKEYLSKLGAIIKSVSPYYVEGMNEVLQRKFEIAEMIRENDPDRFLESSQEIKVFEPVFRTEYEEIEVSELVPYTDQEIDEKAQELMKIDDKEPYITYVPVQEQVTKFRCYTDTESCSTNFLFWSNKHSIPVTRVEAYKENITVYKPVIDYKKKEKSFYIALLQGKFKVESKKKRLPVVRAEMKEVLKVMEMKSERYDLQHYLDLASLQIEEEIRKSIMDMRSPN